MADTETQRNTNSYIFENCFQNQINAKLCEAINEAVIQRLLVQII